MSKTYSPAALAASAVVLLALGVGGGVLWSRRATPPDAVAMAPAPDAAATARPLYWYDPMVPDQHFDKPGKSPFMDMQLLPKLADGAASAGVRIDAGTQQNVGIRTGLVSLGSLQASVRVPGTLAWDLRRESIVSARVDAVVLRLDVKVPYESVRRGQALATVLAPAWSTAIAESRALDHAMSADARGLRSAARERLRVLGLSGSSAAPDGSVVLRSPADGVVSEVLVREGQLAIAGTPMFRINGTQTLWLEAAIPQANTAGIGPGIAVSASVSAFPGRTFTGEVEALLPQVDAGNRTQRARVVLRNDDGLLAPGMFAELSLRAPAGRRVPLIPSEALVATGADSRVIVVTADGSFAPVRVVVGRSAGGRTEILSGLKGGERVVTSGQFLVDSEASLSGALDRLGAPDPVRDTSAGGTP